MEKMKLRWPNKRKTNKCSDNNNNNNNNNNNSNGNNNKQLLSAEGIIQLIIWANVIVWVKYILLLLCMEHHLMW